MWQKINRLLNERQMTMYQLSKKAGIPQATLPNLKAGRMTDLSFRNVCKVADALDVSLDEFR